MREGGALVPLEFGPGQPDLRWSSRAHSLDEIQRDLGRIWARPSTAAGAGDPVERYVSARSNVLNLVVVVRRPEVGTRTAATIAQLTCRLPSRTLVIACADADGPAWLDAQIQAFCVMPRDDAAGGCTEMVYLTAGGEAGQHIGSLIAPLLIHDLPVTLWLPAEPGFMGPAGRDLVETADRLVVDGSRWGGNGLGALRELAALADGRRAILDFALMRQSRWREAIAATFDAPEFTPFLRSIRRITVAYATHDGSGDPALSNLVKPLYHVAWIAGRLGMPVLSPLAPLAPGPRGGEPAAARRDGPGQQGRPSAPLEAGATAPLPGGFSATLRNGRSRVAVTLRPQLSSMPEGTTLSVELEARRRGSELCALVTADAETVHCRVWLDRVEVQGRRFASPRRVDVDLLAEAIERTGDDHVERETIHAAASMIPAAATIPQEESL